MVQCQEQCFLALVRISHFCEYRFLAVTAYEVKEVIGMSYVKHRESFAALDMFLGERDVTCERATSSYK